MEDHFSTLYYRGTEEKLLRPLNGLEFFDKFITFQLFQN